MSKLRIAIHVGLLLVVGYFCYSIVDTNRKSAKVMHVIRTNEGDFDVHFKNVKLIEAGPIERLELSDPLLKRLKAAGIDTILQLSEKSAVNLRKLPEIDDAAIREIVVKLAKTGATLKDDEPMPADKK